jgi:hypothetical protein
MKRVLLVSVLCLAAAMATATTYWKGYIGTTVPEYVELKIDFIGRIRGQLWMAPGATPINITGQLTKSSIRIDGIFSGRITYTSSRIYGPGVELWRVGSFRRG